MPMTGKALDGLKGRLSGSDEEKKTPKAEEDVDF